MFHLKYCPYEKKKKKNTIQGELIDRIEYHVQFTVEKVADGKKELDVAEEYHKSSQKVRIYYPQNK